MSLSERKQSIISILSEAKDISLKELGELLHYSQPTLRRDVASLERDGMLRRSYGRIHWVDSVPNLVPHVNDRHSLNLHTKRLIAKRAMEFVPDNSTIILDSGTTTAMLAHELISKKLTVVTNSLEISLILAPSNSQIICCGGMLQPNHLCFLGPETERFLSTIEAEILFLGASGVRNTQGLTTSSPLQYNTKQAMIKAAKKRIALFDLSKFQNACLFMFADFTCIDYLITLRPEEGSQEDYIVSEIKRAGVNVIFADIPAEYTHRNSC